MMCINVSCNNNTPTARTVYVGYIAQHWHKQNSAVLSSLCFLLSGSRNFFLFDEECSR